MRVKKSFWSRATALLMILLMVGFIGSTGCKKPADEPPTNEPPTEIEQLRPRQVIVNGHVIDLAETDTGRHGRFVRN